MRQMHNSPPAQRQVLRGTSGSQRGALARYSSSELPNSNIKDKAHCLPPYVWVNGACKSSPRGRKETEIERGKACAGGTNTKSCRKFREQEVRELRAHPDLLAVHVATLLFSTDTKRSMRIYRFFSMMSATL